MIKVFIKILAIIILLLTNQTFAWSHKGHQVVGEIAYNNLDSKSQNKLNILLDELIKNLPAHDKRYLKKQSYSLSKLSRLSGLPDTWKNLNINTLISNLNISNTGAFKDTPQENSYDWHYQSKIIKYDLTGKSEKSEQVGKLSQVLTSLISSSKAIKNPVSKAAVIIFISHLTADAHQPLHALGRELQYKPNKNDKGGNKFCLIEKKNTSCKRNLHQYWDNAGRSITNDTNLLIIANKISADYKKSIFNDQIINLKVENWLQESFEYWPSVYNTPENKMPDKQYQNMTQVICHKRLALAGYRLAEVIKDILA